MKILTMVNLENVSEDATEGFETRTAARAVILDQEGNIAMLSVTKDGYHKLPGGGVEEGEDLISALVRECKEETGCEIEVVSDIGIVKEIRSEHSFMQDSYAYLAKLSGEKGEPDFTELELENGFEIVWVPLTEAKRLLKEEEFSLYEGKYIVIRDLAIIEEAERLMVTSK